MRVIKCTWKAICDINSDSSKTLHKRLNKLSVEIKTEVDTFTEATDGYDERHGGKFNRKSGHFLI